MWFGFLDTAQRDFVEAQATSRKAPPFFFFAVILWTLRNVI
jgi:hypothetical protein